jgi:hypothetical protein
MAQYGFSYAPTPAESAVTENTTNLTYFGRTILKSNEKTQNWSDGFCTEYRTSDEWMRPTPPIIYVVNHNLHMSVPSTDSVRILSASDTLTFWISFADVVRIRNNDDFYGTPIPYSGELTPEATLQEVETIRSTSSKQSGVIDYQVTVHFKNWDGLTIASKTIDGPEKAMVTLSLASLDATFLTNSKYRTMFDINFLATTHFNDFPPESMRMINVTGPVLCYE